LLEDPDSCPPFLRDFTWRLHRQLCELPRGTFEGDSKIVHALAVMPGSPLLIAAAGDDGVIRVWHGSESKTTSLRGHEGGVRGLAFRKDGKQLVSGGEDGTVRLWDAEKGELIRVLGSVSG